MPILPGNGFFLESHRGFLERLYVYVRRVQTRSGKPVFKQWTRPGFFWTWIGVSVPTHRMVYLIPRYPTITNRCSCSSKEVENEILETGLRNWGNSMLSGFEPKLYLSRCSGFILLTRNDGFLRWNTLGDFCTKHMPPGMHGRFFFMPPGIHGGFFGNQ